MVPAFSYAMPYRSLFLSLFAVTSLATLGCSASTRHAAHTAARIADDVAVTADAVSTIVEALQPEPAAPPAASSDDTDRLAPPPPGVAPMYRRFEEALASAPGMDDLLPFLSSATRARLAGLSSPERDEELARMRRAQPEDVVLGGAHGGAERAVVLLEGRRDGRTVIGELTVVREGTRWWVEEMRWDGAS